MRAGTVLEAGEPEVVRRVSGEAVSGIEKEGLLPDVDPRAPAATGEEGLEEVGWTKGLELTQSGQAGWVSSFDCATWMHKAREMPKEAVQAGGREGTDGSGDRSRHEIIYFKLYKSQIPVVEQAIETAALMLGTDKSRGYCLEMICADLFHHGGSALGRTGNPEVLLQSITRFSSFYLGRRGKHSLSK